MKYLKQTITILLLAVMSLMTSVQAMSSLLFSRNTLVEVGPDEETTSLEVFSIPQEGETLYYLSVGQMAIGNRIIQVYADPVSELFIPLGTSLDEAMKTLETLYDFFKMPKGSVNEVLGCLNPLQPKEDTEFVKVYSGKQLFSRYVEFTIERDKYLRVAQISKGEFRNLMSSMKIYRKLHPKEK